MPPLNFLPWHEQRESALHRYYGTIIALIAALFILFQLGMYYYHQPQKAPLATLIEKARPCENKQLTTLTLQAILISPHHAKIITKTHSGETLALNPNEVNCWQLQAIQSDTLEFKHSVTGKITLWKLGAVFK